MAVLSAACLAVSLSGCGNWIEGFTEAGQLGVTVDEAGQPVVAVMTCSAVRPVITMYEGRKPSEPESKENVKRGSWVARKAFSGVEKLPITVPGNAWKTTSSSGPLEADRLFVVEGFSVDDDLASVGGTSFRTGGLAALSPDQVRVNGKVVSWTTFGAYQCAER